MLVVIIKPLNLVDILGTCRATKCEPVLKVPIYPKLTSVVSDAHLPVEELSISIKEFEFCEVHRPGGLYDALVVKTIEEAKLLPHFQTNSENY